MSEQTLKRICRVVTGHDANKIAKVLIGATPLGIGKPVTGASTASDR